MGKYKECWSNKKIIRRLIPREYWGSINPLLVGFGQQTVSKKLKCNTVLLISIVNIIIVNLNINKIELFLLYKWLII